MRISLALVIACSGAATQLPSPAIAPVRAPPAVPMVTVATALVVDEGAVPPVVLIIDANGRRSLAAAATWTDLAAGRYEQKPDVGGAARPREPAPPPPPPEDDDVEESYGVNVAINLEEGPREPKRPRSPRMGEFSIPPRDVDDPMPKREALIVGELAKTLELQSAVILAAPTGKASALVTAIVETQGMIGVAYGGAIRRLRLQFVRRHDADPVAPPSFWMEARFGANGLELEAVPEVPILVASIDAGFGVAFATAAKRRPGSEATADVLVAPDTDVQRFVDLLVALDAAGVRTIGIGMAPAPGSDAAKARGHRPPMVRLGLPTANGDLDKSVIRATVRPKRDDFLACFVKSAGSKGLEGYVHVSFFIKYPGMVETVKVPGVDPNLARCIEKVVLSIGFPKPKGGGGVQVDYPLRFLR